MKNISKHIVLLLVLIAVKLQAQTQTQANIIKKDTTMTGVVTIIATQSITLKPNTWIKPGSTFTAKISTVPQIPDVPIPDTYIPVVLSNQNYILNRQFQKPMKKASEIANNSDVSETITYFDGLGRPIQKIAIKGSGTNQDLVTHIEYDGFGRQRKEYLPYASSQKNGSFIDPASLITNVITQYQTNYGSANTNPFSEKSLEASPLNRVLKQAAPGKDWAMNNGHEIKFEYQTNTASEVKLYTVSTNLTAGLYDITLGNTSGTAFYAAGELYKNVIYDENTTAVPFETAGSTVEFKNKEGQIVLKRTYNAGLKHDTYYVYDIYGNLTYVIPPKADGAITQTVLEGLCYQYKYDNKNRLVEKRLPGKQWEFIVYDKLDRPVATGPAFSPFTPDKTAGWLITKYDILGRPIYTGWSAQSVNKDTRNTLQLAQNSATTLFETKKVFTIDGIATNYNNSIAPTSFKLLTVNYYDDYTFPGAQIVPSTIIGQKVSANTKGLATGNWTRVLTTASSTAGEIATIFYDSKGRVISNYMKNHLGGISHTDSEIDFAGKMVSSITEHQQASGGTKITVDEKFVYSAQNRLLTHTHQIDKGTIQLLVSNSYDALGQLIGKNVGNTIGSPLQKIDYNYNIRGWLTEINKTANLQQGSDPRDLFAFKINYNTTEGNSAVTKALYNGNIAETFWTSNSDGGILRGYGYQYDLLNRLKNATYQTPKLTDNKNYFGENMDYDKNGNIMKLQRKFMAGTISNPYADDMDNLGYFYPNNSNQLMKVTDTTNNPQGFKDDSNGYNDTEDDYAYDDNGNLIKDQNKSITEITYNHLNLPKKIAFGTTGNIEYIYNASGQKLEKIVTEKGVVTNTKYLNGFQYKNNILQFFPTTEGYVKNTSTNPTTNVFQYVFNYLDHLGNVRISYTKNPTTSKVEILEESNYYPFGFKHQGYNDYLPSSNKYKYNGMELQDELGLNMYDYGNRNYDPATGRWNVMDGKGELYFGSSPYVYASNTPVQAVDPDGNLVIFINGMHGGSGGTSDYWRAYQTIRYMTGTKKVMGFSYNTYGSYQRETASFDRSVMNQLGDGHAKYVDGTMGGATSVFTAFGLAGGNSDAMTRVRAGESQGKADAKSIIDNLVRDKTTGEIVETIKIITHSMGGAYGKGYVKALKAYIKTLPKEQRYQIKITLVADFDPYQGGSLAADRDIKTQQFMHEDNSNVLGMGWLANEKEGGAEQVKPANNESSDHSIMTFIGNISKLSEGTYKWNGKNWEKQ